LRIGREFKQKSAWDLEERTNGNGGIRKNQPKQLTKRTPKSKNRKVETPDSKIVKKTRRSTHRSGLRAAREKKKKKQPTPPDNVAEAGRMAPKRPSERNITRRDET